MDDAALFSWIQGVTVDQLPPAPLRLNHCTTVMNIERWLEKLKQDAALPKGGPRGYYGAIQADIRNLYELIEGSMQW